MSLIHNEQLLTDFKEIKQWITKIINIESKSTENLTYLENIVGPIKNPNIYDQKEEINNNSATAESLPSSGAFTHQIIFKIDEKVFINKVKIYEKVVGDSSILKIEALVYRKDDNGLTKSATELTNNSEWLNIWETKEPIEPAAKPRIFIPTIIQTPFKTDIVRFTVSGNLHLIDGIEIHGNKLAIDEPATTIDTKLEDEKKVATIDPLKHYSLFSKDMYKLILNDLFADVYLEVEGKIIPAHRNILICRSEYFRAMLSTGSSFKESNDSNHNKSNPVYIKDFSYEVFKELLNYIYTGCINYKKMPYFVMLGLMRAADELNILELQKLVLFYLSLILNTENVVEIYREASETPDVLKNVIDLCYDLMSANFLAISKSQEFCSLDQHLMVKVIENVVPKLNRVTSVQLPDPEPVVQSIESTLLQ